MREADLHQILQEKTEIIYKYLLKIGANPRDAEDVTQEALYKFLIYMDSIDPKKALSWLFRVAINQYYDLCRKQKKQVMVTLENFEFIDDSPLPDHYMEKREMGSDIQLVLDQLTPLYKQLLLLKYDLELSYGEIADMLDLNEGTLKTYLFRARKTFKELYRKEQMKYEGL
ncbi:RNA polymerase sigma factor [Bacillus pinisoli]|uniref:RNA polymerase sigma factor n=1 Tax=Bacillus pinisoli TaxID=2901866 RepID=UPI001FF4D607|nr:RNA polymerase sigma factor [Bacillus pinisoli]